MLFDTLDPRLSVALHSIKEVEIETTPLAELTTLHVGGHPLATVRCRTKQACIDVLRKCDEHQVEVLIVGGGSNLVVADGKLPMIAVVLDFDEIVLDLETGVGYAEAGAVWDDFVDLSIKAGFGGLECLSGIPGSVGATPVQNVGAYGVEIADVLTEVELYFRDTDERAWLAASHLDLRYRHSNLKYQDRVVVLAVKMALNKDGLSQPIRFGELARALGIEADEPQARREAARVRDEVLRLRKAKGMVYDEADYDSWSAGSFFTNPIVSIKEAAFVREIVQEMDPELARTMPEYEVGEGLRKLSAAWLIDRAGFAKGFPNGAVASLSTKHTLALTNRGTATAADIVALAAQIRDGVFEKFGVELVPEPVWVGIKMPELPNGEA
ncbi:UDP-N-acetylmuramate dehydrogenase [Corynebacterium sp. HS2168-gen11]|uniref:UDP-N-acetylmuramate dehydrogenase n=1 Tax=Corynebacterium sp. HS2168-gen11 TaxID=2974027 RepID=UPI00216AE04B|nr:UDP-N-acetylmuramate dehydrogenase [Corynebacterium sp. HS2168-gen11]MCS4535624.1 UDP-N-acetylmuramate dehydrogenase [Corynebacterium sp. HS2168-gen11]